MRSWPMLMQRGSTWYFRRIVPLALRPMMEGKREIWRSLRTSDFNEAKLLSLREGQEVERLFQSLRKQSERAQVDPEAFARQYESRRRSADAEWRLRRDIAFRGEDGGSFRVSSSSE
jgi:cold shock CspA family protein